MKAKLLFGLLLVSLSFAQTAPTPTSTLDTQTLGYWVDPSTGLMWAAKDNGEDITWRKAMKYCGDLRLAGYTDWRLPTIVELEGIYDGSGFDAPHPKNVTLALAGKAKGGLRLTGNREWSSDRVLDDRGHRTGFAWQFDFPHGNRDYEQLGYYGSKRALCVRSSGDGAGDVPTK